MIFEIILEHSIDETSSEKSVEEDTSTHALRSTRSTRSTRDKIPQRYKSYYSHRVSSRLYPFVLLTYIFSQTIVACDG